MSWTLFFLVVAIVAAFFGFSGLTGMVEDIGKVVFSLCTILFLATFIFERLITEIRDEAR